MTSALLVAATLLFIRADLSLPTNLPAVAFPLVVAASLAYSAVGAIIVVRRPERRIGSILMAVGLLTALLYLGIAAAGGEGPDAAMDRDLAGLVATLSIAVVSPATAFLGGVAALLFPTDRLLGPRWSWGIVIGLSGAMCLFAGNVLTSGPVLFMEGLVNPLAPASAGALGLAARRVGFALMIVAALVVMASLIVRYRIATPIMRKQIRLFVAATIVLGVCYLAWVGAAVLGIGGLVRALAATAFTIALFLSPIAILVAMARHRLYELDRLAGRSSTPS